MGRHDRASVPKLSRQRRARRRAYMSRAAELLRVKEQTK